MLFPGSTAEGGVYSAFRTTSAGVIMPRKYQLVIMVLILLVLTVCVVACKLESKPGQNTPKDTPSLSEKHTKQSSEIKEGATMIAESLNSFGEGLFDGLDKYHDNLIFSPLSTYTTLSMAYAGAAGRTAQQIEQTLRNGLRQKIHAVLSQLQSRLMAINGGDANQLLIANALWLQEDYAAQPEFMKICQQSYGSGVKQVDFGAPELVRFTINRWTADNTKQRIKELIQPNQLTQLTRLVLTNAIYFKGSWQFRFDAGDTREMPFKLSMDEKTAVPTMFREGYYNYAINESAQILELPYAEHEHAGFSMMLILPQKLGSSAPKLLQLAHPFENLERRLVRVFLPKFKIQSNFSLKMPLIQLGIQDAFDDGRADFSGITGSVANKLAISEVVHNAFVEVNESGTEAAAASGVIMATKSMLPPEAIDFRVDRPFIFAIRENRTGVVVFWGRVVDPRK